MQGIEQDQRDKLLPAQRRTTSELSDDMPLVAHDHSHQVLVCQGRCANIALLQAVFRGASVGIALIDQRGRVIESNPALQRMLGYTAAELGQMTLAAITHPDDVQADCSLFEDLIAQHCTSYQLEKRYIHKTAGPMWGRLTVNLVQDNVHQQPLVIATVEDITTQKTLLHELAVMRCRLVDLQEAERQAMARELHDSTIQQLITISHQLEQRISAKDPSLELVRWGVVNVMVQLRDLIGSIRPIDVQQWGLTIALTSHVERLQEMNQPGMPRITLNLDESGLALAESIAVCLLRVAQEALRNSLRHAEAGEIAVSLRISSSAVQLSILDDGQGFHVPPNLNLLALQQHFGLLGMAERVACAGGQLTIGSLPGHGTNVTVCIPLEEKGYDLADSCCAGR